MKPSPRGARERIVEVFNGFIAYANVRFIRPSFPYPVALVVDEATALAGRSPEGRGRAATDINDDGSATVYIVPRLLEEAHDRQCGVLAHELGHVHLLQCAHDADDSRERKRLENHSERAADEAAEELFDVQISYDADDIQTIGPGVRPRPASLDRKANPALPTKPFEPAEWPTPTHEEVHAWAEDMRKKLGLRSFDVYRTGKAPHHYLKLHSITVAKEHRGEGRGTTAVRALCSFADRYHLRVALTPALKDDRFGTTSKARLVRFYKRFGFVLNKGRNKDFTLSEGMYRPPQGGETRADRRARAARFGPKEAEEAWQAGRRAVREYEQERSVERAWRPDYVRDRLKGAQGD